MEHSLVLLEKRVMRLEARNRMLGAAIIACLLVFLTAATTGPEQVESGSFRLLGSDGSVRAELTIRDGNPGLYLKDAGGVDRVSVFHEPEASGVYINDPDGVTRIGVAQFSHGGGGIALHGPESKGAAVLYLKKEGSLRFFDADGAVTNQVLARAEPVGD